MPAQKIFVNARVFTNAHDAQFEECMVVRGDKIAYVGSRASAPILEIDEILDLNGKIVTPAFIDSHCHFLSFGMSLQKLDLSECRSLDEIRQSISTYAKSRRDLPRLLCRGWQQSSTSGKALASMIDDLDGRPVFIEALDLHSTWCNSAALKEVDAEKIKVALPNDVQCDGKGSPTGLLAEGAQVSFVWPHLMAVSSEAAKFAALESAVEEYKRAGYTGFIDMAMDKTVWNTLSKYRAQKGLPFHIAAHWFIPPGINEEKVEEYLQEAISMHEKHNPLQYPDFCITGIKLMADGVVDGCTASLSHPYGQPGSHVNVKPFWPNALLHHAVQTAAKAGLQVAIHAIGDQAISQAVAAIASAGTPHARHRIEHLELASAEDAAALAELGITASIQPVHSDPAILKDYRNLIGEKSWSRAFPYNEFSKTNIAIGTDAPTARHYALPNLYNATTRKSATDRTITECTTPHYALDLNQALIAATEGAAYSRNAEGWIGSLREGLRADFVVLDAEWAPETLLEAKVLQTWSRGEIIFDIANDVEAKRGQ
ncbi:amidohydrolase 3 [Myriangium duriaei CBS 260.36]|uniref:Amidohydrolase 3 n=1 Tax=Myriangium duriaei CBS 260.36 TaxID=1168546 RepID=A0A9P4MBX5_9PEZI|nr:amidohydrolase 3 [Myriangium duriaei CBS 260.36]